MHLTHRLRYSRPHRIARLALGLAALTLALMPPTLQAQDKPPLKIMVGFPPGGSADVLARLVADALREDFGPIIVDNKPGAGGRIALNAVKAAKPDGQTVIVLPSGPMVLFPHVYKKLDYDAVKDFTPVSQIARFQFGVVSGPASNVKNVTDMVAKAKSDPGNASYGTPGAGTLPHFMGVLMEQSAGISLNHVPFQGGSPANNALLGGHIGYKFDVVSETAEMHRAGKVRIIAVTGSKRDPQVPEVPTLKESGVNMDATAWFAMYGPAGLKADALTRLEKAMMKIARDPAMKDKMLKLGYEPIGSSSADLAAAQKADLTRWEKPIKATGVQLD
ncbi:tripartite tricarboxylate transporter substrate binding protein [Limnohabitans sp. 2KL-1]|uniref:Bug family tripartite tricarboxylate transporter substrate binding protein n=1 Tax=Limnohabitans sp. 2KL-1 TaxID=1100699 RepID=UPI001E3722AD|nr:Bug family tripartite tricarboxylate transporter substrate binding protein [Limnohabitans sp. 2KL-1]